jgi:hypothetical protein
LKDWHQRINDILLRDLPNWLIEAKLTNAGWNAFVHQSVGSRPFHGKRDSLLQRDRKCFGNAGGGTPEKIFMHIYHKVSSLLQTYAYHESCGISVPLFLFEPLCTAWVNTTLVARQV